MDRLDLVWTLEQGDVGFATARQTVGPLSMRHDQVRIDEPAMSIEVGARVTAVCELSVAFSRVRVMKYLSNHRCGRDASAAELLFVANEVIRAFQKIREELASSCGRYLKLCLSTDHQCDVVSSES